MSAKIKLLTMLVVFTISFIFTGCFEEKNEENTQNEILSDVPLGEMKLTSTAFKYGETIPKNYTKYGEDMSPPLNFENLPNNTKSLVLVMDDFDANNWVHWLVWNIPANITGFKEGENITYPKGLNDFGDIGYGGPQPPAKSGVHNYRFILYALNIEKLDLNEGAARNEIEQIIDENNYAIEKAVLMCEYKKN